MTAVLTEELVDDRLARRNALLLAFAQASGGASASIVIATGPLVGYMMLETDKSLATLPVSAMVLGTAFGTIPAGMFMRRFGRRAGFAGSALLGMFSGLLASYAVFVDQFLLFSLACWSRGVRWRLRSAIPVRRGRHRQ